MRRLVLSVIVLTTALALLKTTPVQSSAATKATGKTATIKPLTMEQMDIHAINAVYIVDREFEEAFRVPGIRVISEPVAPARVRRRGTTVREHHSNTKNRHRVLAA